MTNNGANLLVSALSAIGVRTIFSLSGNQIMPIFDACIDSGIKLVHVRHEAAAVYMAEAWAQLNGDIGVALIPAGPGFANGLSPLYSARASESPVLLLSGDSPLHQDSMGAFQELDQVAISKPLTKFSSRPQTVDEFSADLARAIRIARSGRKGPVHLAKNGVRSCYLPMVSVGSPMARLLRVEFAGALYHLTDCGDCQKDIYLMPIDRIVF